MRNHSVICLICFTTWYKIQNGFYLGSMVCSIVMFMLWTRESVRNAWALRTDEFPIFVNPNGASFWLIVPGLNVWMFLNIWQVTFQTKKTSIILYLWFALYCASIFCFINDSEVIINHIGMLLAPKLFLSFCSAFLFLAFKVSREQTRYVGI